jgi:hypothetical protein
MLKLKFRLQQPTIGIFTLENGERVVMTLPTGAIVAKLGPTTDEVMTEVSWEDRKIRVFEQDLRERGLIVVSAAG